MTGKIRPAFKMTEELGLIIRDFELTVEGWERKEISTEQELVARIMKINERLNEELPKQKLPVIEAK